ncbi:hypothetical protein GRAN_1744 [Granulicella sibirica]|uniref:Uncharacterized protein n=1 Tax=Granulicella sibirica TaxID=2479048 RepID=A0A4V1L690_9BACT|nr:hypothetical protein GRAN_1744 [Granulicella sibirica]
MFDPKASIKSDPKPCLREFATFLFVTGRHSATNSGASIERLTA